MTAGGSVRRIAASVAAMAAVVGLAACGISSESSANRIDPGNVPFGLLEAAPSTTQVDQGRPATVYLVAGDRLVAVDRTVPEGATLADLVEVVITGPNANERALGATTAVPSGTVATVAQVRRTARVDLTTAFGEVRSDDQLLAIGQIVYTLTGVDGVDAVQFSLDGDRIGLPAADGTQRDAPVERSDLAAIAPR